MLDLNGKRFSPVSNSSAGRVASDAVFIFTQLGKAFTATYSGEGFSDGHLIGQMTGNMTAHLIYHCRAEDGSLEAGEADATFKIETSGKLSIAMNWQWLNRSQASGTSFYGEI